MRYDRYREDFGNRLGRGRAQRAPRPLSAPPRERDLWIPIARKAVPATTSETTALGRRRVDVVDRRQSFELDAQRTRAMSVAAALEFQRRQAAARALRAKVLQASAADRRMFHPAQSAWPSTIYGTAARTRPDALLRQAFQNPDSVVPCIRRKVRREVLFAKKKHGSHKGPRRRTWLSHMEC